MPRPALPPTAPLPPCRPLSLPCAPPEKGVGGPPEGRRDPRKGRGHPTEGPPAPSMPRRGPSEGRRGAREGIGIPFCAPFWGIEGARRPSGGWRDTFHAPHRGIGGGATRQGRGGKTLRYPGAGIRGGAARQGRGWARAPDPPGPPWQGGIALGQRHAPCLHVGVPGRSLPPLTRGGPGRGWTRGERRLVPGAGFAPYPAPKKHPAHQSVRGESENGSRLGARPAQPGGGRAGDGCDDAIKICPRLSRGCLD